MMPCERCKEYGEALLCLQIQWPNQGFKTTSYTLVCEGCHEALHQLGVEHERSEELETTLAGE